MEYVNRKYDPELDKMDYEAERKFHEQWERRHAKKEDMGSIVFDYEFEGRSKEIYDYYYNSDEYKKDLESEAILGGVHSTHFIENLDIEQIEREFLEQRIRMVENMTLPKPVSKEELPVPEIYESVKDKKEALRREIEEGVKKQIPPLDELSEKERLLFKVLVNDSVEKEYAECVEYDGYDEKGIEEYFEKKAKMKEFENDKNVKFNTDKNITLRKEVKTTSLFEEDKPKKIKLFEPDSKSYRIDRIYNHETDTIEEVFVKMEPKLTKEGQEFFDSLDEIMERYFKEKEEAERVVIDINKPTDFHRSEDGSWTDFQFMKDIDEEIRQERIKEEEAKREREKLENLKKEHIKSEDSFKQEKKEIVQSPKYIPESVRLNKLKLLKIAFNQKEQEHQQNYHNPTICTNEEYIKEGYLLNSDNNECVTFGRSYNDNDCRT